MKNVNNEIVQRCEVPANAFGKLLLRTVVLQRLMVMENVENPLLTLLVDALPRQTIKWRG